MISRITLDIPRPLAEKIMDLSHRHRRYPKQEILVLLEHAVTKEQATEGATRSLIQDEVRHELRSMLGLPGLEIDHD